MPLGPTKPRSESIAGVDRALDVLMLFVRSKADTLGVTEIAEEFGASKAAVHRILSTFRNRGFIELDETVHRYRLGPEILVLGLSYLDRMDLRTIARPLMTDLAARTNETVTLSVRIGWTRVYVDQVLPERDIKMMVQLGKPFPLHAGASSKALLAFMAEADSERYLREHHLDPLTSRTVTDPERLALELASIREKGFAVSFGERDAGAGSVAAPVFDHDGVVRGVISVSGPLDRFSAEVEQSSQGLVDTARDVSRRLGHGHRR
ncbi:MAG: IclR family transcriptional regulator [Acidimicrobiales bacterium]